MKWLKRKIWYWLNEIDDNKHEFKLIESRNVDAIADAEPILNFRVFSAVGGQVIEFRRYDPKTERSDTTTYVIHKDDDFGEKISKIANLELLK